MNIFIGSTLCFGFCALLLGFIIYLKRRDRLGKLWFIYSLLCSLWATGYAFQISDVVEYGRALWISRFADAAAVWIPVAWLRFVYEFLGLAARKRIFLPLYGISGLIFATFPTPLFIERLKDKSHIGFAHFVAGGPSFHAFTVLFAVLVVWGFYRIIRGYREPGISKERKTQIGYLLAATALGFGGGSPAFLPVYDIDFPVGYATLIMPFFPFMMAMAMIRYRLLDLEELAQSVRRDKLAAIGTLATSINHEIRNPLYIIQGLAESHLESLREGRYLSREQALDKSNEILAKAAEQSTRAMEIMKRFSQFAKQGIEDRPRAEEVSLQEMLDGIIPLVGYELALEKIELVRQIPDNLPLLQADRRHLEEIFFNLIVNACQAMKETGGKIEIGAEQQNNSVRITIEDNGPGIPADRLAKIFEPFYTTKEEGTGLGLYIVKQLVERNGGKISVRSRPGKGTAFTLEFKR